MQVDLSKIYIMPLMMGALFDAVPSRVWPLRDVKWAANRCGRLGKESVITHLY